MASDLTGRTLGEFVVEELIAKGGGGTVYRAFQASLDRRVAIKVMDEPMRKGPARERFLREAQLASQLDHPYAAHVHASGSEPDGLLWIAMELVPGTDLETWLRASGAMPPERFVPFLERLAEAIDAVHGHGIVHRDIKTSNVMVIEGRSGLIPKLLDFGIAKAERGEDSGPETLLGSFIYGPGAPEAPPEAQGVVTQMGPPARERSVTPTGENIGSWAYMSPEQWNDASSAGRATDIYSLGVLSYRALTGRYPFIGKDENGYFRLHREAPVPPLGGALPPAFDRVIGRALAKAPEQRHASALELAADFRAALRAAPRERLRSTAQQWDDLARPPELLLRGKVLSEVRDSVPPEKMSELECSFVKASHRRALRVRWVVRSLAAVVAAGAVFAVMGRSAMQARLAEQQARVARQEAQLAEQQARAAREVAEAKVTESALERGRSELLHGEPEALRHLLEAYRHDPAPSTAFMLARAMQPRLSELARLPATHGRMWWATFSPDASQIATADDRAAQVWDGRTYALLFTLPHGADVYQAAYTPDGTRLVTAGRAAVRIWDAKNGTLIRALESRKQAGHYALAISPDGRLVAAVELAGALVHVWDAANGALIAELRNAPTALAFPRIAFSADGWLATSGGGEARVFDVRTWKLALAVPGPVRSLAADAHGRLLTGAATGEVALWDVRSALRLRQLRSFGEPVEAVAFSADGALVAAGSGDGAMQAWRTDSGAPQGQLNARRGKVVGVEFSPDGALLLAANAEGTVIVADSRQGLAVAVLDGPSNALRAARFSPDGSRVVGASWDGTARVWDAASPYRRWSSAPIGEACASGGDAPDHRFVGIVCKGLPTRVWDTAENLLLAELPGPTPAPDGFLPVLPAVSEDRGLVAISRGNAVEVYEIPDARLLRAVRHGAPVSSVAFAGRNLVSGAVDGSVLVTRDDDAQRAFQAVSGIDIAKLLPDGSVVVSDAGRRLRIYGPAGVLRADLELPARLMSIQHEAGRLVALPSHAGEPGPPLLVDLVRPRIAARLEGHVGWVYSTRWVPGGRVLTAGADGTARLWDGTSGQLLRTFRGTPRYLVDATLTPDGLVVAGGADGLLRFWDAETGDRLWTLPVHKSSLARIRLEGVDIVTRGFTGEISRWRLPTAGAAIGACGSHPPCAIVLQ